MWQRIKSKELKGISIEGYFVDKMQSMSETEITEENILNALSDILKIK